VFPVRYGQTYGVELSFKYTIGQWILSRNVIVIIMYHRHKPIDRINLLDSQRRRNVFPVRFGQTYRIVFSFKYRTGQWILSRNMIVMLIYNRHKPIDRIHLRCGLVGEYCRGKEIEAQKQNCAVAM
jgi:hypothetical protein